MFFENQLIYFPHKYPSGDWYLKEQGLCSSPVEDVFISTSDGEDLHGWLFKKEGAKDILLYFHGNGGNITNRYAWACSLSQLPANVLIIDYRGYGRSSGRPNEAGLYKDAEAALAYAYQAGYQDENILLLGESLGGGVATYLAVKHRFKFLILQSTFTSIPEMAGKVIPFFPKAWVSTQMNNLQRISEIKTPTFIIHSRADEVVPFHMGEHLYKQAANPAQFLAFDAYGHNNLTYHESDLIVEKIKEQLSLL